MNNQEFEQLFDKAFDESVKSHEFVPDSSQSWIKVQKQLTKRARARRSLRHLPYISAAFLLGAIIFGTPTVTTAFQPFYQAITIIKDGVINVVFGSVEPSTKKPLIPPPPDHVDSGQSRAVTNSETTKLSEQIFNTWEEASHVFDFHIPPDIYVPDGYRLEKVQTMVDKTTTKAIISNISYIKAERENYFIMLRKLDPNEVLKSGADVSNGDITFEKVHIGNTEAYFFNTKDGTSSIEFFTIDTHVTIVGAISKEDTIKIAKALVNGRS